MEKESRRKVEVGTFADRLVSINLIPEATSISVDDSESIVKQVIVVTSSESHLPT